MQGQTSLLDQIKVYSGIAIAAGTAIEERRLPPPEGGDSQDEDVIAIETSTRVTRSQQDETDMGTMLTPECKFTVLH